MEPDLTSASLCDACTNPGRCCTGFTLPVARWKETPLEALVVMATVNVGTTTEGWSLLLDPRPGKPRRRDLVSADVGLPFMPLSRQPNGNWRWWCPHLVKGRCSIYEDRPTLCRQFEAGTDPLCCMHVPDPQEVEMETPESAEVASNAAALDPA